MTCSAKGVWLDLRLSTGIHLACIIFGQVLNQSDHVSLTGQKDQQ